MTSSSLPVVLVGTASCVVTSIFWQIVRHRRLKRLLRTASQHPDPDRRLSALFIAATDGLGRHLDLVLACARAETADVVRTSLVDLVMEERWKSDRDERVVALRAWAQTVVAQQRHAAGDARAPTVASQAGELQNRPSNGLDASAVPDVVAPPLQPTAVGRVTKRSATHRWVRSGGLPEIDALEVFDAIARHDARGRRSGGARRATAKVSATAATDGLGPGFELLVEEWRASNGPVRPASAARRQSAGTASSGSGTIRLADAPGDISAAV